MEFLAEYKEKLKNLYERLLSNDKFLISTHQNSDPDGIGAELALAHLLKHHKKNFIIVNPDPVIDKFMFLDKDSLIHNYKDEKSSLEGNSYTVVIVDNADINRIGELKQFIKLDKSNLIVIDHHDELENLSYLYNFPKIGSTCEILYELLEYGKISWNYEIAMAVYSGMITDNGRFKYNKTTVRSFEIAGHLFEFNFPLEELTRKLFENYPLQTLYFKKEIFNTLEVDITHHIACIVITRDILDKNNFESNPAEGLINEILSPIEIFIAVSFTELKTKQVKVSFRSKGSYNVCNIARQFSGGGHVNASGCTIDGDLKFVKELILQKLINLVKA